MGKSTSRRDEAALTWKPQLKNAPTGKRSTSTSITTGVADQALSAMRRIDQVREFNGDVEGCAAKLAGAPSPRDLAAEARSRQAAAAAAKTRKRRTLLLAGLAVAGVGVAATTGACGTTLSARTGMTVAVAASAAPINDVLERKKQGAFIPTPWSPDLPDAPRQSPLPPKRARCSRAPERPYGCLWSQHKDRSPRIHSNAA